MKHVGKVTGVLGVAVACVGAFTPLLQPWGRAIAVILGVVLLLVSIDDGSE